jgi:hypothetical protein
MWLPSSKIYSERHLNEKNYFGVENIPVIAEEIWLTVFTIGILRGLYNHH